MCYTLENMHLEEQWLFIMLICVLISVAVYVQSITSEQAWIACAAVCVLVGALVNSRYVGQRSADINCENCVTSKNPVWQTSPGEGAFGVVHGPLTQKHWLSTLSTTTKFMSELLPWQPVPDFMAKARLSLF